MNRRFYIIIGLMAISLVGICAMQYHYISNAYQVKEQQFEQNVYLAMGDVIASLEEREAVYMFSEMGNDWIDQDHIGEAQHWLGHEDEMIQYFMDSMSAGHSIIHHISEDSTYQISLDFESSYSMDEGPGQVVVQHIVEDSAYAEDHTTMVIDIEHMRGMHKRMRGEFILKNIYLEARLNGVNLDTLIRENLVNQGIDTPFEYGVINVRRDSILEEYCSQGFCDTEGCELFKKNLFPHDLIGKTEHLALEFPERDNYVMSSMGWMLGGSIFLTLMIIVTFASTIYFMFRQKRLSEMKSDFINNMTHELKTPIATINLAVDSIAHPKVATNREQVDYYANIIREENARMNTQVESVLRTAMFERKELELQKEKIDVHELITETAEHFRLQAEQVGANIELDLQARSTVLEVDPMHLSNAVNNLIDNGIKYSDKDIHVTVSTRNDGDKFVLEVRDRGIGMKRDVVKSIFDKFYRAEGGNIHTTKGFGIGLSYVKAVIDAHGGVIRANSAPGVGTTMTIELNCHG